MAMTEGTVTVNSAGTVTKSGAAGELYDAFIARYQADGNTIPSGEHGTAIKKAFASIAGPIATLVGYIQSNGAARIADVDAMVNAGGTDVDLPIV
jgi:hypothetical protein